jgi:hypothetical protein
MWPESTRGLWNSFIKDELEGALHELVCGDQLDLMTAQREIARDWIAAFNKYVSQDPHSPLAAHRGEVWVDAAQRTFFHPKSQSYAHTQEVKL